MAARSVIVDLESEESSTGLSPDQLVFQDIPHTHHASDLDTKNKGSSAKPFEQTHTFTNFPNPNDSADEEDSEEQLEYKKKKAASASFWTFEYYQTFFDVDTRQVLGRIIGSVYPNPRVNYLQTQIRPNPDLYGPFWICTTLVFCIAVSGNIAKYIGSHDVDHAAFHYDFHKVTIAATTIYLYWLLMPSLLYGLLWWRGNHANYTLIELSCIYGYSLFVYIPISILWVIPVGWLQWILVIVGMALSGTVLVFTLWPSVRNDKKPIALGSMVMIMLLHGLLAVGFLMYFFPNSSSAVSQSTTTSVSNVTTTAQTFGGSSTVTFFTGRPL